MIKRFMSILMITMLTIFSFIVPFAVNAEESKAERYTVLALDLGGDVNFYVDSTPIYNAESPIEHIIAASVSFLEEVKKSSDTNYVAVVGYNDDAEIISDFTNEYDKLIADLKKLGKAGQRNLSDALTHADELFAKNCTESDKMNLVLFTTGMTSYGDFSETGKYDKSTVGSSWRNINTNVYLYQYANAANILAEDLKNKGVNIYTIGLFKYLENMPEEGARLLSFFSW